LALPTPLTLFRTEKAWLPIHRDKPPIAPEKRNSKKYQQAEIKKIHVIFGPEGHFLALYKNYK